jgi:hypothetical protein
VIVRAGGKGVGIQMKVRFFSSFSFAKCSMASHGDEGEENPPKLWRRRIEAPCFARALRRGESENSAMIQPSLRPLWPNSGRIGESGLRRASFFLVCLFYFVFLSFAAAEPEIDFAPFFQKGTDIYGNARWRALGPIFESRHTAGGDELLAMRPFYSYAFNAAENLYRRQMLYPVLMTKGKDAEMEWHFLLLFNYHDFDINDPYSKYRLWLIPIYFQGRDVNGTPYLAIFPLAGSIREFIVFDEFRFALFPLALSARINDVRTTAAVWPILARTTGGGNDRLSIFPLFGYSKLRAESEKYYFLWPIWTYAHYNRPQSPGYGYILFPFYGRVKLENQSSHMFIPPLFRFAQGTNQDLTYCPWPFIQDTAGAENRLYLWPLLGSKNRDTSKYAFFLWPLGMRFEQSAPFYNHTRFIFFPVLYATSTRGSFDKPERKMDQECRTLKVWPLFSYVSDTGKKRFSLPSIFPYRDYDAIERNYAPFWTIYTHSSFKGASEDELFWGLINLRQSESEERFSLFPLISVGREKKSGQFTWSFLKGLIAREKAGEKRRIRLLYFLKF